jgi:general nucleoside transport system permease protein
MLDTLTNLLASTIIAATPLALGAYCGIFCERAGVVNIGIEGMMLTAACVSQIVAQYSQSLPLALLAGICTGGVLALFHAVICIRFKADQIISGTVINILATGLTGHLYQHYLAFGAGAPTSPGTFPKLPIPVLEDIPILGPIFFQHQPIVYAMLVLTFVTYFVLFRTPWGLRTRAVGEHPRAADTVGINVYRVRYINVVIGGMIAGLAGCWFTLEWVGTFNLLMTGGKGFIALAAMIFGKWSPFGSFLAAIIFGFANALQINFQLNMPQIPYQFLTMAPYLLTMIVLAGVIGRAVAPAADGLPYEKGQ